MLRRRIHKRMFRKVMEIPQIWTDRARRARKGPVPVERAPERSVIDCVGGKVRKKNKVTSRGPAY